MVEAWGRGRKDYSSNVEYSVIPVVRSHQTREQFTSYWDLRPYWYMTIENEPYYGCLTLYNPLGEPDKNYVVYDATLSYDTNVLIKAYFMLINTETWVGKILQIKYGYGRVSFRFPKGLIIYKEIHPPWYPGICFLPGGYLVKFTMSLMETLL